MIYAYELPAYEGEYVRWDKLIPHDRHDDRKIYCNVDFLRKALGCFVQSKNNVICISIPQDPLKVIALSNMDEQAIVSPVRITDGNKDKYAIKNLYCEVNNDD